MRRVGTVALATLAIVLVAWGALHVFISPVNPAQESPDDHYNVACWGCHLVLESAPLVE